MVRDSPVKGEHPPSSSVIHTTNNPTIDCKASYSGEEELALLTTAREWKPLQYQEGKGATGKLKDDQVTKYN